MMTARFHPDIHEAKAHGSLYKAAPGRRQRAACCHSTASSVSSWKQGALVLRKGLTWLLGVPPAAVGPLLSFPQSVCSAPFLNSGKGLPFFSFSLGTPGASKRLFPSLDLESTKFHADFLRKSRRVN